jgi:hypothetical protein
MRSVAPKPATFNAYQTLASLAKDRKGVAAIEFAVFALILSLSILNGPTSPYMLSN